MKVSRSLSKILTPLVACALLAAAPAAQAQDYPTRTVSMVLPFPAGGGGDTIARMLATRLSARLGKTFVVENKPGATGLIGISSVMQAPADGHTVLFTFASAYLISPQLHEKSTFDPMRDFQPITVLGKFPFCLIVNNSVPAANVKELIDLAKRNPGKLFYGTNGEGSMPHLISEIFKQKTGTDIVHAPYRGGPLVNTALIGGQVQMYFDGCGSAKGFSDAGRVKLIAASGHSRPAILPHVPTFEEAGVDGIDLSSWMGIFVSKGTPDAVVQKLYREVKQIMDSDAEFKTYANGVGLELQGDSPAETAQSLKKEYGALKAVIDRLQIKKQ